MEMVSDAMADWWSGSLGPAGPTHRLDIALYSDTVPRTAENFRRLCVGDGRLSYKRSLVHKARFSAQAEKKSNLRVKGDGQGW